MQFAVRDRIAGKGALQDFEHAVLKYSSAGVQTSVVDRYRFTEYIFAKFSGTRVADGNESFDATAKTQPAWAEATRSKCAEVPCRLLDHFP